MVMNVSLLFLLGLGSTLSHNHLQADEFSNVIVRPGDQTNPPIALSTVSPSTLGPTCGKCTPETVWTDVVFVIDTSANTGMRYAQAMWSFVISLGESFTIQPSNYTDSNQYMRVGVINYSDDVEIVGDLGTMSFVEMENMYLPYKGGGENGTDLEKAIRIASEMFNTDGHRPNARKVIFLLTTKYNPITDPGFAASDFKSHGGVFFSYEWQLDDSTQNPDLKQLASPNYYFHFLSSSYDDVIQAHCDANCFCMNNYQAFGSSKRGTPIAGCYNSVTQRRSLSLANKNCLKLYNGGYVATVQTAEKQYFLTQMANNTIYIIGLENKNGALQWSDGSPLGSYHPYRSGSPSSSDMVIVNNGYWDLTNNLNTFPFVCESSPCSSNKYCGAH